jgi:DNA-binding transcriptional LysR family regulator
VNLHKIDLNLLPVFDAIAQTGSLTVAARELHLSQPAVSHALARLREHLGDALFTRQGRRMLPTPYARHIMPLVRQTLQQLQAGLRGTERGFAPELSDRVFTLGMRDILETLTLPGLMAHIRQHAPGLRINSIHVERQDMAEALRQGRVDAVVDVVLPVGPEVVHQRLLLDRLVVVARGQHPMLEAGSLTLPAYLGASHVLVSARPQGLGLEDFELSRQGQRRQIGLRCRNYFAACRVVSMTDMLLTMPEQYARVANQQFDNVLLPFPLSPAQLDAHLYWHQSLHDDPTNLWFRTRVMDAVNQEIQNAQTP